MVVCPLESSEVIPDTHGGVCRLLYSLLYSLRGFNPFYNNELSWVSSPQNTGALLPKTRGRFSPKHATSNVPRPVLRGSSAAEYSGAGKYAAARMTTCGGSCRVLAGGLHKLTACGVHRVCAAGRCVGGPVRVARSGGVCRRRGVRLAAWRARRMRARLVGLSVRQAAHALCHAGGTWEKKALQNCGKCVSITSAVVW
jgi:hypothetical protein